MRSKWLHARGEVKANGSCRVGRVFETHQEASPPRPNGVGEQVLPGVWRVVMRWEVKNESDDLTIWKFRNWVPRGVEQVRGAIFTCEDLALHCVATFAFENKLPFLIYNGFWSQGLLPSTYRYDFHAFLREAKTTTGARDLSDDDNTELVGVPG